MKPVIQISNLSKIYRLGEIGTGTISRDLERWYKMRIRGQEDPFLKIGETNDRGKKGVSDVVYSLKDINLEVQPGEALGIIGKNGAGKSTLLKILSRVTSPTTGKIHIKGRVASLLEVGTGFHPELTGLENIYLNGAILGMRKKEITRKLDEIIDFSGVERYIDTPVKRYSSGMYVRLAFAVAAHLESEIMIVDEVLAVGDADFQKKCLGKMGEVSKGEGRTVLFVSHNLVSVKSLCHNGILLENGKIILSGRMDSVINGYLGGVSFEANHRILNIHNDGFRLIELGVCNKSKSFNAPIVRDEIIQFIFEYENFTNNGNVIYFMLKIKDDDGRYIITTGSDINQGILVQGRGKAVMEIPAGFFNEGSFSFDLWVNSKNNSVYKTYILESDVLMFHILPENKPLGSYMGKEVGYIRQKFYWSNGTPIETS